MIYYRDLLLLPIARLMSLVFISEMLSLYLWSKPLSEAQWRYQSEVFGLPIE